jgi:hypothetical protein
MNLQDILRNEFTQDFIETMESEDVWEITHWKFTKAFKNKVVSWFKKRWENMSDSDVIKELLITKEMKALDKKYDGKRRSDFINPEYVDFDWSVLFNIVLFGPIDMIPLNIFEKIPKEKLTEKFMHGSHAYNSMWRLKSIKSILLKKKNVPADYKNYLESI